MRRYGNATDRPEQGGGEPSEAEAARSRPSLRLRAQRAAAFTVAAAIPTWLALDDGGFDSVVRQQGALILCWALALGLFSGVLPRARLNRALAWPAGLLAALIAWTAFSLTWTDSAGETYDELTRTLSYAALAALAWVSLNRRTFRAAAAGLSAAAIFVALLALLSRLAPAEFPADDVAVIFDVDRLNYPLGYWNALAAWGCMAIAVGLVWSAHARTPVLRALAAGAVPAAGLAVYLTYSRAGAAGAVIAIGLAIVLSRNRWTVMANAIPAAAGTGILVLVARGQPAIADATGGEGGATVALATFAVGVGCALAAVLTQQVGLDRIRFGRVPRLVSVGAGAAALVIGVAALAGPARGAWDSFLHDDTVAETARGSERLTTLGGDRDELWGAAIDSFSENTLAGTGPGTFEFYWSREGDEKAPVEDAHSLYLETMAELGFVGVALLLGAIVALVVVAVLARGVVVRGNDAGACAAMIAAFGVFAFHAGVDWMWEYPALAALGLGGIAVVATADQRRSRGFALRRRGRIVAGMVALVAGAAQIPGIVSTERLRDSERELAAGQVEAAVASASDAVDAQPWAAEPLAQRALAEEAAGDLEAARRDLREARESEPDNWLWAAQLARVELALGNDRAAANQADEARSLNKISPEEVPVIEARDDSGG